MGTDTKAFIFDIDGTLLDSNDSHAEAWTRALNDDGFKVSFKEVRPLIGMGSDKLLKKLTGLDKEEHRAKEISKKALNYIKTEYLAGIQAFPKVSELFSYLRKRGCKIIIATSADSSLVKDLLKIAQVEDLVDGITSAKDVEATKPEPDLILAALGKLESEKADVKMVGDTRYDIESASRAGLETIAFRCGGAQEADLTHAVEIYDGPEDFLRHLSKKDIEIF